VLYFFTGGSDGGSPQGLIMDSSGTFYGTTSLGGISNNGTVFSLTLWQPDSGSRLAEVRRHARAPDSDS